MKKEVESEIRPISPVLTGLSENAKVEVKYAKNQPEYRILPSIRYSSDDLVTRWKFPLVDRIRLLFTGNLFIHYKWKSAGVPPLYLETKYPKDIEEQLNKEYREECNA